MTSYDIVFAGKSLPLFIARAELLGYSGLIFLVKDKKQFSGLKAKLATLQKKTSIDLRTGFLASGKSACAQADLCILVSPEDPRLAIEQRSADFLVGVEGIAYKDKMHHRASGMNQVLARLAVQKRVGLCTSWNDVVGLDPVSFARITGRIKMNIRLAAKYGFRFIVASFATHPLEMRNPQDIKAFFSLQGMPSDMQKRLFSPF